MKKIISAFLLLSCLWASCFATSPLPKDTTFYLSPVAGDNWPQLQQAINYQIATPGVKIKLNPGNFYYSQPLIFANIVNNVYQQVSFDFEGAVSAKNTPAKYCSVLLPTFNNGPAIGVQLGKGFRIANLCIQGLFSLPATLNQMQVDTLPFASWDDGLCRQNRTSVYCGVAVDFASDPAYYDGVINQIYPTLAKYYIPGMSRGGSTAGTFEGLAIKYFVVDFIITPSFQQNGDIIHVNHCQLEAAKVAYAMCQAQSKQDEVNDLETWVPVHTVFDNVTYGVRSSDGANTPWVNGTNFASYIHQVFNFMASSFPVAGDKVYGEGIFKLGFVWSAAGGKFSDFQIDFQNAIPGYPSPDFYIYESGITNINCMYRLYSGVANGNRISLVGWTKNTNTFIGGAFNLPPVQIMSTVPMTNTFLNTTEFYGSGAFSTKIYDSIAWAGNGTVTVNKSNWNGYIITSNLMSPNIQLGNPMMTYGPCMDQFNNQTLENTVGFVTRVSGDTIFLSNVGWGIKNGQSIAMQYPVLKQ